MPGIDRYVTRELVGLEAAATCREAARLMAEKRIGAVAVSERGKTLGLVTERDLIYNILLAGRATCEFPISQAMRRDLPVVSPAISETECSELMRVHFTRHLLVADKGKVVGIISMRDVIRLMLDEKQWLIDQLQIYIRGR
jgi:CBS domain-containing protein